MALIGDTFANEVFLLERSLKDKHTYHQNFKTWILKVTIQLIPRERKGKKNE